MSLKRVINSKVQGFLHILNSTNRSANDARLRTYQRSQNAVDQVQRPTRTFDDFFEHLKVLEYSPTVCIDVGAATGTLSLYRAFPDAQHIVFEPLPDFRDELKANLSSYNHVAKYCALSNEIGSATLLRHSDPYGSSIMHSRERGDEKVVDVETSTLDAEMADFDLNGPTILKTDCQGSDLMVLQGGVETLKKCEVVITEASLFRFWGPHQPDFYDIVSFMKSNGFSLYDVLDGLYRPHDSALGQLDLVFVKDAGEFRSYQYW